MKNKTTPIFVVLIIAIIALLAWAKSQSEPREVEGRFWEDTDISCLIFGHQNLASHIHPTLSITVDGEAEAIPSDIGVTNECMSEVHTHDTSGALHVESMVAGRTFTLLDFFKVRGESIDRDDYSYQVLVNGQITDVAQYVLRDGDRVELQYLSGNVPQVEIEPAVVPVGHDDGSMETSPDTGMEFEFQL